MPIYEVEVTGILSTACFTVRAWADEYEKRVAAQKVIEEQAQTIEAQEIALGDNRDWKAVTAIPWLKDIFADTSAKACGRIGKTLTALSRHMGMEIRKAEDDRWGTVNVIMSV